jgi:hypothetical protein
MLEGVGVFVGWVLSWAVGLGLGVFVGWYRSRRDRPAGLRPMKMTDERVGMLIQRKHEDRR